MPGVKGRLGMAWEGVRDGGMEGGGAVHMEKLWVWRRSLMSSLLPETAKILFFSALLAYQKCHLQELLLAESTLLSRKTFKCWLITPCSKGENMNMLFLKKYFFPFSLRHFLKSYAECFWRGLKSSAWEPHLYSGGWQGRRSSFFVWVHLNPQTRGTRNVIFCI